MIIETKRFKFYAYFDSERLPKYLPINIKICTFEDHWRTRINPELNSKRRKYLSFNLNVLGYYIILDIPYKVVGTKFYGKEMKNRKYT